MRNYRSNIFNAACAGELADIRNNLTSELEEQGIVTEEGDITIPVQKEISSRGLFKSDTNWKDRHYLFDAIKMHTIKKLKCTPTLLRSILSTNGALASVYGLLIVEGKFRCNPLHPITSLSILKGNIELPSEFTLIIYEYKHKPKMSKDRIVSNIKDITKVISQITPASDPVSYNVKPSNTFSADYSHLEPATMHSYRISVESHGNNPPEVLVPIQYIASSVVVPFYGLTYTNKSGGQYNGNNIFPMISGNIQGGFHSSLGTVCTGELANSQYSSLPVINTLNTNSTYYAEVCNTDFKVFVEACKELSCSYLLESNMGKQ